MRPCSRFIGITVQIRTEEHRHLIRLGGREKKLLPSRFRLPFFDFFAFILSMPVSSPNPLFSFEFFTTLIFESFRFLPSGNKSLYLFYI